jgi:nucleoside-diphosphate-sugar epimerase
MKNQKTSLVTGGAGFIGSFLCEYLLIKQHKVICLDNLLTGNIKNISELKKDKNFFFYLQDITDISNRSFSQKLNKIDYIFHFASPASPPLYRKYSIETLLVNSIGTLNMLRLAQANEAVFLLASTSEVYGNPLEHPQKETYYGNVNPIGLRSCYDEAKRFAESITMEFVRKFNLDARIVRIFNTYGPKMKEDDGRVVSNFITQALKNEALTLYGEGDQTRSFCYVSDLIEGIYTFIIKENLKGEVINLGNPQEISVKEIGKIILELTKSNSKIQTSQRKEIDDPSRRKPDISKAMKLLGWKPRVDLSTGLQKTIEYFKKI